MKPIHPPPPLGDTELAQWPEAFTKAPLNRTQYGFLVSVAESIAVGVTDSFGTTDYGIARGKPIGLQHLVSGVDTLTAAPADTVQLRIRQGFSLEQTNPDRGYGTPMPACCRGISIGGQHCMVRGN